MLFKFTIKKLVLLKNIKNELNHIIIETIYNNMNNIVLKKTI